MVIREWKIATPTPRLVQLEWRLIAGEFTLSVDGLVHASWSQWTTSGPPEPIVIDGVAYTLSARIPGFRGSHLFRTQDLPHLPHEQRLAWDCIVRAVFALALSVALFSASGDVRSIVRRFGIPRDDEPLLTGLLVFASVFFFAGFFRQLYVFQQRRRPSHEARGVDRFPPRPASTAGALPRNGASFRPLLTDVTATAASWKHRLLRRSARLKSTNQS